ETSVTCAVHLYRQTIVGRSSDGLTAGAVVTGDPKLIAIRIIFHCRIVLEPSYVWTGGINIVGIIRPTGDINITRAIYRQSSGIVLVLVTTQKAGIQGRPELISIGIVLHRHIVIVALVVKSCPCDIDVA